MWLTLLLSALGLAPFLALTEGGAAGGGAAGEGGEDGEGQGGGESDGQGGDELAGLRRALKAERDLNAAIKRFASERGLKIGDLLKRFADLETAGKSEAEKLAAERDRERQRAEAAIQRAREKAARAAIVAEATKAGARNPELIFRLVRDGVEYDDADEVTNAADLIAQARKEAPDLFRPAPGRGDAGSRDQGGGSPHDEINRAIRRAAGFRA